jgi:drug/metabolite transporter (DMT)-like permease
MSITTGAQPAARGPESLALLLATGGLNGSVFLLTRLAQQAGVPSLPWALAMMIGAGGVLALIARLRGDPMPGAGPYLRYYALAGLLSIALPNVILFLVLPRLGAGLASIVYTLPPILTLLMALALRIERPDLWRSTGMLVGLAGALLIVLPHGSLPSHGLAGWMALAFAIPVSLAAGNVYRTVAWPAGARPVALAAGTMLAGGGWVAAAFLAFGQPGDLLLPALVPGLVAAQVAATAVAYLLYFRLQAVAGPVYLSQIGYLMTAVGLATGMLVFDEHYSLWVWSGAGVIVVGVLLVTFGRRLFHPAA